MKKSQTLFEAELVITAVTMTTMTVDAVAQSAADHFTGRTIKPYPGAGVIFSTMGAGLHGDIIQR
jgi:hypothetical protein